MVTLLYPKCSPLSPCRGRLYRAGEVVFGQLEPTVFRDIVDDLNIQFSTECLGSIDGAV